MLAAGDEGSSEIAMTTKLPARDKHAIPPSETEDNLNDYPVAEVKRGRGRPVGPSGVRMTEQHRLKIQNSNILSILLRHVQGTEQISQSRATVGLGLLRKVLPDLSQQQQVGADGGPIQHQHIGKIVIEVIG
jgi:hypothetical protein